ncbi:MAG: phosphodiester glycosidase family protein [Blastocatellia bacterium]|nr:phosphodiester glycosidase family protein [Blastocatellia bacterium]
MKKDRLFARKNGAALARALIYTSLCLYASAANLFAQEWRTVADGVEQAHVRRDFSGKTVDINLLRLDLKKVRLDVHHALDKAIGLETTSSIAKRKRAVAAVNGGFFRLDKSEFAGDAAGILQIDGEMISESANARTDCLICNDCAFGTLQNLAPNLRGKGKTGRTNYTETLFRHLRSSVFLTSRGERIPVSGMNRARKGDELVVYTPAFGPRTLTSTPGFEVVVKNKKIVEVRDAFSNSEIPSNGYVITATGPEAESLRDKISLRASIWFSSQLSYLTYSADRSMVGQQDIWSAEDITNGLPQLIKNGKIDITWEQEKASKSFVETRHPRTAVAKLKNGKFLMLTADGRSDASAGLDLYDLAKYMHELGAVDAMNLDGGGSTTMFLDGKVVNKPSDKVGERKIGDAIVVTLRKPKKRF